MLKYLLAQKTILLSFAPISTKLLNFMPLKIKLFVLLFCICSLKNHAQKNLQEATIVFNNTDTTRGFIDYKEWTTNPYSILFTTDKNAPAKRFEVSDVTYFDVAGLEQYSRKTVKISLDKIILSELGDRDTTTETKTVFLKVLVKGKNVTLFSYRDKLKLRFYVQENGSTTPVELLNSMYMINGQISEDKEYRFTLANIAAKYLPEDKKLLSKINEAGYFHGDIEAICYKLNFTTEGDKITLAKQKLHQQRFFVGAGINQGTLTLVGFDNYNGNTTSYIPVADAGYDWVIKPQVGRIVLRLQLHATAFKTDAYRFRDFTQYTEQYFFKYRQVNIGFHPQLLYNVYNQKQLKWFVSAGAGFNFSSYPSNQLKFIRTSSTNSGYTDDHYIDGTETFWLNTCVSTGIDYNRFEFNLAYFPKASNTRSTTSGIDNSSLQLKLNYYLIK